MMKLFELGQMVVTQGASELPGEELLDCLSRHAAGDWGDLDDEDKATNQHGLKHGQRLMSVYKAGGRKVWIITERDRSVTTILLPEEY